MKLTAGLALSLLVCVGLAAAQLDAENACPYTYATLQVNPSTGNPIVADSEEFAGLTYFVNSTLIAVVGTTNVTEINVGQINVTNCQSDYIFWTDYVNSVGLLNECNAPSGDTGYASSLGRKLLAGLRRSMGATPHPLRASSVHTHASFRPQPRHLIYAGSAGAPQVASGIGSLLGGSGGTLATTPAAGTVAANAPGSLVASKQPALNAAPHLAPVASVAVASPPQSNIIPQAPQNVPALAVCPVSFQQQLEGVQLFPSSQFSSDYGYFQQQYLADSFACAYYFYTAANGGCSYFCIDITDLLSSFDIDFPTLCQAANSADQDAGS